MEMKPRVKLGRGVYDWQFGGNSAIQHDILVPDKNWKVFKVAHEIQWQGTYDTQFCVTYSALKAIAKFLTYLESVGALSQDDLEFFADYKKNGMYDFAERFPATLGETDENGAYQWKVASVIKNYGLIPQDMFPLADNFKDNVDPKFITQAMYDKGQEFLKRISINYEWIDSFDNLIYSPIQTVVRFANYVNPEDILTPEGELNHAVTGIYGVVEFDEVEDSYWQEYKRYRPDYTHSLLAYFITINKTNMDTIKFLKDNDKKWVRNSNTGQFGRVLQGKLMVVQSTDRGTLMLLDDKVRENGIQITNAEWEQLPKINF